MIAFAWLIAMVLVGYIVERWASSATTRFLRLAIDRGLLKPDHKSHRKADSLTGFLILTGESFGRVRALITPSVHEEVEAARKAAMLRWFLAPVVLIATAVTTWSGLIALNR